MERSFSIVDDSSSQENLLEDEDSPKQEAKEFESDSEENNSSPKKANLLTSGKRPAYIHDNILTGSSSKLSPKIPSDLPIKGMPQIQKNKSRETSSDSDEDASEKEIKKTKLVISGEYDPKQYEQLEVDDEIKDIFQYILKYTSQQHNLEYKFRPFVPEYLPAVGDIDAFLKVVPPETTISNERFDMMTTQDLGLIVLDEPTTNQSDPALLHLQLRVASNVAHSSNVANVVTKRIDKVEQNIKTINKWIKDISDLHKSKSSPIVKYSQPMPDIDDLMQEWPEDVEAHLKEHGFPYPDSDTALPEYINTVCGLFEIPLVTNKIQSLHLLFCLFAVIKNSQLFQANKSNEKDATVSVKSEKLDDTDQLVLD